ncbi:MAG: type-F conjugative transfer system pilin assembly protein TrbC, partial [Alphaproteobacteria bacterium]|nr:type-F conjugative transfer system pilin assembly protein TrbC [Alphaproteobacteria bacterium]
MLSLLKMIVLFSFVSLQAQAEVSQQDVETMINQALLDQKSVQVQAHQLLTSLKENKRSCVMQSEALPELQQKPSSTLLVFATLSMSDEALKAYVRDLRKVGGRLVIRGLIDNSFLKTSKRLKDLGIEADIDPTAFEAFKIEHVPTIIHANGNPGAYNKVHDRMTGNVSVLHTLEEFERSGECDATALLKKLR